MLFKKIDYELNDLFDKADEKYATQLICLI